MTNLLAQSKIYLSSLCGLSNLEFLSENKNKITFAVPQSDFLTAFSKMRTKFGDFKAYPVDTAPGVTQIDAVWTVAEGQHVLFVTELTDNMPVFFVSLLNALEYIPSSIASELIRLNKAYDQFTQTDEWNKIQDTMDVFSLEEAAKRVGFSKNK